MTLTVRLDSAVESALERYCTENGVNKSMVVRESLTVYLLAKQVEPVGKLARSGAQPSANVSANYKAFADAGFIGGGELGGGSADKAAVRERAMQRMRRNAR